MGMGMGTGIGIIYYLVLYFIDINDNIIIFS